MISLYSSLMFVVFQIFLLVRKSIRGGWRGIPINGALFLPFQVAGGGTIIIVRLGLGSGKIIGLGRNGAAVAHGKFTPLVVSCDGVKTSHIGLGKPGDRGIT